ncbi:hypothetical protein H0H10_26650 [Streptomyces sp. TRM S81-3]|uniref:Uncharacterized protein n=1 Tax=Streptomyces griseicoloratus TaxID=2752516 RepID=A0A926QTB1_9ACTN|nr:hypothetical protein [Streptomyces griseicoloratus]MBD0422695.1 hypothetical protein [Streptomyces griseicoloratus]
MPHTAEWKVPLQLFGRAVNNLAQQLLHIAERDIDGVGAPRRSTRQAAGRPM